MGWYVDFTKDGSGLKTKGNAKSPTTKDEPLSMGEKSN